ncbi:hypothetical protein ARMSODRAFT_724952 [Armillaria solidipes]|uniref:Uncharacterized protein n=1 Tax=Armillaria solidipes TaxID=1076256 RepID=A0A2H3ASF3_9AGAR|nr:hypothetical protein ARMSODRAFT_724952 [Armillaria solidipes]
MNLYHDHLEGTNAYAACFLPACRLLCGTVFRFISIPVRRYASPRDYLFAYRH